LWLLGYPEASRNDAEHALKNAREIGQAATLMYALSVTAPSHSAEISLLQIRKPMSLSRWQRKKAPCTGRRKERFSKVPYLR
jgi:hypothetical protein